MASVLSDEPGTPSAYGTLFNGCADHVSAHVVRVDYRDRRGIQAAIATGIEALCSGRMVTIVIHVAKKYDPDDRERLA